MPDSIAVLLLLAAVTIKVAALVVAGLLADRALGRANAATRHLLWTAVMGGVLFVMLTAPLPATWSLPKPAAIALPADVSESVSLPGTAVPAAASEVATVPMARSTVANSALRWSVISVLVWLGVAAWLMLRLILGGFALSRIAAGARPLHSGQAAGMLGALVSQHRIARRIRLIESDELAMPATWGVLAPVIALPRAAAEWSGAQLDAVLRHELAHVQRYDALTQLVAEACCALLWFHPGVWFAARRMRVEREHACDDAVLRSGAVDVGYANFLLGLAATSRRGALAPIGMAERSNLERRLCAILDPALPRSSSRALRTAVAAAALLGTLALAGLDLWRAPSLHASLIPRAAADTLDVLLGRLPAAAGDEQRALARQFVPRNSEELQAFARLQAAARHQPLHVADLIRDRAVWALSVAADDRVFAPVLAHLTDTDWRVRAYAAWTLGLIGAGPAQEALTTALRDPAWRVRAEAAAALERLGDPRTTNEMLSLLADSAWQVRASATDFLGRINTPEARAALRGRLNDPHIAVRTAAATALSASSSQ